MSRRVHVNILLRVGPIELEKSQAHHVRDVLRLMVGDAVEAFDDAGNTAAAVISQCDSGGVAIDVEKIEAKLSQQDIVIASAVPKGERADWMIEKLSELGVSRFIPLMTARSVVLPKGKGKRERWLRLATESAKQSRRAGVMQIDELTPLKAAIESRAAEMGCYLHTTATTAQSQIANRKSQILFIGPEGGWTDGEIAQFKSAGLTGVKLTATILRTETAAVVAAAIALVQ